MKKACILLLLVLSFGVVPAGYYDNDYSKDKDFKKFNNGELYPKDNFKYMYYAEKGYLYSGEPYYWKDYPKKDYKYKGDYKKDYWKKGYWKKNYYYKYNPYKGDYEKKKCYNYPPKGKLFYVKCPY